MNIPTRNSITPKPGDTNIRNFPAYWALRNKHVARKKKMMNRIGERNKGLRRELQPERDNSGEKLIKEIFLGG